MTHEESDGETRLVNGNLTAVVERSGRVSFRSTTTGEELMGEPWFDPNEPPWHPHRRFLPVEAGRDDAWTLEATFAAYESERIYGLGQHTLDRLDLKGCVVDLLQRNSQIAVPVLVSSRGYGMFWNCPSIGRVELAQNHTRWVAEQASQIDYFVYAGATPAAITERYAELTGFAPAMPHWATGYWQSNSFYPTQDELLSVAANTGPGAFRLRRSSSTTCTGPIWATTTGIATRGPTLLQWSPSCGTTACARWSQRGRTSAR